MRHLTIFIISINSGMRNLTGMAHQWLHKHFGFQRDCTTSSYAKIDFQKQQTYSIIFKRGNNPLREALN